MKKKKKIRSGFVELFLHIHIYMYSYYYNLTCLYKNTVENAVACAKAIAMCCARSGTVRRLVYTASVFAASPLKDDGSGFKDSVDETCWTPLHLSIPYSNDFLKVNCYIYSHYSGCVF